jgi:hypothetical protein
MAILEVLQTLSQKSATLLTTNYDDLLERQCSLRHIGRSNRDGSLTFLEFKIILFVGCGSGLEDPNFGALLKWASERQENIPNRSTDLGMTHKV